jgi:hypothetical protein
MLSCSLAIMSQMHVHIQNLAGFCKDGSENANRKIEAIQMVKWQNLIFYIHYNLGTFILYSFWIESNNFLLYWTLEILCRFLKPMRKENWFTASSGISITIKVKNSNAFTVKLQ